MTTALRHRQVRLVEDVLALLRGERATLPTWSVDDVVSTAAASGLVPLAASLALFSGADDGVRAAVADLSAAAASSSAAVATALPWVLEVLTEAAVPAVLVGDAAMANEVWADPATRPATTIEVIVPHGAHDRAQLALAPLSARLPEGVEVVAHDGWVEHLLGFDVDGCALEPSTFDHAALLVHTVGRLSAAVVRGDVRGLAVVDAWWCAQREPDWVRVADLMAHADPRLTAPGLWLIHRLAHDVLPEGLLAAQLGRLPERAREELQTHHAVDVLHDPSRPALLTWRTAFAETLRERKAAVRDRLAPGHEPG